MTAKNSIRLGDLASQLGLTEELPAQVASQIISSIGNVVHGLPGEICFVSAESYLGSLQHTNASVVVINDSLWARVPEELRTARVYLKSKDAMLAFAKASKFFDRESKPANGIHPSSHIHPTVKLGKNISIAANVVIGAHSIIGDHVMLHPGVVMGEYVQVGADSCIFPNVTLYDHVVIGERVRIHASAVIGADGFGYVPERHATGVTHTKIHHVGTVRIGNDVEIGASTSIDRGTLGDTIIGNGCKIDNQVQIGHNCHFDEGVIVCGSTGIAGSAKVGKYAVIAGFVGVGNKVEIGAGATIAGFSMVYSSVPPGIKWGGVPARPIKEYLKLQAIVSRLPEIYSAYRADKKKKEEM